MKNQSGKSPLGWIITIVISLLIVGVIIAVAFVGNEDVTDWIEQYQNKDTNNTVQTQSK